MIRPVLPLTLALLLASSQLAACDAAPQARGSAKDAAAGALAPEHEEAAGEAGEAGEGGEGGEAAGTLMVDRAQSKIGFAVAKATVGHLGHFEDYDARMELDGQLPQRLEVFVKMASVVADRSGLTTHLQSDDFFDVAQFPTSSFSSTKISAVQGQEQGTGAYEVVGTMRLHGMERELKFPANIEWSEQGARAEATLEISAKAFGIAYAGMEAELASDLVSLEIDLVFPRVAAPAP